MARIKFDANHNPKDLTMILCTQTLQPIGAINNVNDVVYNTSLSAANELTFTVHKYNNEVKCNYWDEIRDFRIIKISDFDEYYSITVEINDTDDTVKNITATSLCEIELAQTMLFNLEINTETDITNDSYVYPTIFYRDPNSAPTPEEEENYKNSSLLHRVLSKMPHYEIGHVDNTLKTIQRTFSADSKDVYSFLTSDVAEEVGCLFTFTIEQKNDGTWQRYVNAYDLYTNCESTISGDYTYHGIVRSVTEFNSYDWYVETRTDAETEEEVDWYITNVTMSDIILDMTEYIKGTNIDGITITPEMVVNSNKMVTPSFENDIYLDINGCRIETKDDSVLTETVYLQLYFTGEKKTTSHICGYRGEYTDVCPECGGTKLKYFGKETSIFINKKNLSQAVNLSVDTDSIKNCFRLEAGDDLMTATVANCNPNGSLYLYHINEDQRDDMPKELVQRIDEYDSLYNNLKDNCQCELEANLVYEYNTITKDKIKDAIYIDIHGDDMNSLPSTGVIKGYNNVGTYIYDSYDLESFLTSEMMPTVNVSISGNSQSEMEVLLNGIGWQNDRLVNRVAGETDLQALNRVFTNPIAGDIGIVFDDGFSYRYDGTTWEYDSTLVEQCAIKNVTQYTGVSTCNVAWKNYAKSFINTGYYKVEIADGTEEYPNFMETQNGMTYVDYIDIAYTDIDGIMHTVNDVKYCVWHGRFKITNRADDTDFTYSPELALIVNDCTQLKVVEAVKKLWADDFEDEYDLISIQSADLFKSELKKYCLNRLTSFLDAYNNALDTILAVGTEEILAAFETPYNTRIEYLEAEIGVREKELETVESVYTELMKTRNGVQKQLDFEAFLGETNYKNFCVYRREDKYSNSNYISDGMNNAELFANAEEFLEIARNEIYKAGQKNYTLQGTLANFLLMKEFDPIVNMFELGNWIRFQVEDDIYILRIIKYTIDYGNFSSLAMEFSEITKTGNFVRNAAEILDKAASMASSYSYVAHQASNGNGASDTLDSWVEDGLSNAMVTMSNNTREEVTITSNGILCRDYDSTTGTYSDDQFRITHNMIMFTEDGFNSSSLALGRHNYTYYGQANNLTQLQAQLQDLVDAGFEAGDTMYDNVAAEIEEAEINKWRVDTGFGLSAKFVNAGYIYGSEIIAGKIYSDNYNPTNHKGMFIDLQDGSFSFAGGDIVWSPGSEVEITGKVNQVDGTIASWNVGSDGLYYGTLSPTSKLPGTFIGHNGIRQYNTALQYIDMIDGKLTAKNADISGKIGASELSVYDSSSLYWKQGVSGTFKSSDNKTVTVINGIITDISEEEENG